MMEKSICKRDISLLKLLSAINEVPAGISFIIDDEDKLCGVVTDGDLRRMLLAGYDLTSNLKDISLGEFVFAKEGESIEEMMAKTSKKVRLIPIVNDQMHVVDYFRYEHKVRMLPVAEPKLNGNEFRYLMDAFLSTWISSRGKYIDLFEKEYASYCGVKYGLCVSNGTVAIQLALEALGISNGDEVIVPDLTFAATINPIIHTNATPVLVDINTQNWCIEPSEIEKAITPKTRAIIPVHLYGQPCNMDAIMGIAEKHNLKVIEDASEAHGASFKGKKVGGFGDISTFSFFGNKIITTGEGGICLTNSEELYEKMKILRDHGMDPNKKYWHKYVGYNFRMTNLQASIGCAQLERIETILENKKNIEIRYKEILSKYRFIEWQQDLPNCSKVVWLVSILINGLDREKILDVFKRNNIDIRPFFYPLHEMDIYEKYHFSSGNASKISKIGINLPTVDNIDYEKIDSCFAELQSELEKDLIKS